MTSTTIRFLLGLALLSTFIYAGGDIAPVTEPVTEPESDDGSAMGIVSMLLSIFLTTLAGSFFIKKEK